jgi:hypothetical protein
MKPVRITTWLGALLCIGLFTASPASAAYEQVGCFAGSFPGLTDSCKPVTTEEKAKIKKENEEKDPNNHSEFGEEVQLGGVGGMAVNYTGTGGVPEGTVYAATRSDGSSGIAMFAPKADGGLEFRLRWELRTPKDPVPNEPYERCGPALGTNCPATPNAGPERVDVDVDQSTGNVYTFRRANAEDERSVIAVYKPDGSELITRFGMEAISGKATAETPDQLHETNGYGPIAVNAAGEVFVEDENQTGEPGGARMMKFVPKVPGDYTEYIYAGIGEDIPANSGTVNPVFDASGHLYVINQQSEIDEYDPANPKDPPLCTFKLTKGGIISLTVDASSGEPFFYSYKDKRIRQLGPCNEATGKFEDPASAKELVGEYAVSPVRAELYGLAFDPERQLSGRLPGVLYGGAPQPVSAEGIPGGEPGQSSLGYVLAHPVELPPEVKSQSVTHVTTTTALLHAQINPKGPPTQYAFQYLTQAQYEANEPADRFAGASEAPLGGGLAGEGPEAIAVSASLSGLSPDTAYRFRAVATNHCSEEDPEKVCEDVGADASFHTFPADAPGLPDHRAYELVSPPDKQGGQVYVANPSVSSCNGCRLGLGSPRFPMLAAPDGDAVTYEGSPFSLSEGSVRDNAYLARRDPQSGWHTAILSPVFQQNGFGHAAYSPGLDQALISQGGTALSEEAPAGYPNLYAQATAEPTSLTPLIASQPPNRDPVSFKARYAGASADLSRAFFEANDALPVTGSLQPTDGAAAKFNLYEWQRETGELRLVNLDPGNATTEPGASFANAGAHAISADGSRAFWSDASGQLYVREDPGVTKAIPGSGPSAKFLAAASDGARVLLTDGHIYDLDAEASTDLTEGNAGFLGLAGQSEDLTQLYFVDSAILTGEEENSEGDKAQAGKPNLYAWSGGGATFLGTLLGTDVNDWAPLPVQRAAEASPAGRYLAFVSRAPLTGADTAADSRAVFLYDSQSDILRCPSCNTSGVASLGRSLLTTLAAGDPASAPQPRFLTDSGRLYFDSRDSLLPGDTNEGIEDVYQWEPPAGPGEPEGDTCQRAAGCLSLISAGTGTDDSNFVTIDPDGSNVFFTTRDQLLPKDRDQLVDLYDAREFGGIPADSETSGGGCQGEACQPQTGAPAEPESIPPGDGNVGEPKPGHCPEGRRKKHGRCVKERHTKRNRKHKSHRREAHR